MRTFRPACERTAGQQQLLARVRSAVASRGVAVEGVLRAVQLLDQAVQAGGVLSLSRVGGASGEVGHVLRVGNHLVAVGVGARVAWRAVLRRTATGHWAAARDDQGAQQQPEQEDQGRPDPARLGLRGGAKPRAPPWSHSARRPASATCSLLVSALSTVGRVPAWRPLGASVMVGRRSSCRAAIDGRQSRRGPDWPARPTEVARRRADPATSRVGCGVPGSLVGGRSFDPAGEP